VRAECHWGSVGASPSRVPRRDSPDHATLFSSSLTLPLESPFSLRSTLKFGLIFLALQVAGTLVQRALGQIGCETTPFACFTELAGSRVPGRWPV
jgi:hypothetical protein